MTTVTERSLARCEGCGKAYRVPDPDRRYSCKACGGIVVAEERAEEGFDPESEVVCTACHAVNGIDEEECAGCGQDLRVTAPLSHEEAREAQREASLALKRDYRWIGGITWAYRLGAAGYLVGSAIAIGALVNTNVPLEGGTLVVGLFVAMTVLMLMGAIQILFRPFEWTLAVAVLATVTAVVHVVGPNPLDVAVFWSLGWAVAFWVSVVPTWRFRRDIRSYTDLYVTHHASHATRTSIQGRSPKERHDRLVRAMRRANRSAWKLSLGAAIVVVVGALWSTNMVRGSMRPEVLEDSIAAFEEAWRSQELETLAGFYPQAAGGPELERVRGMGAGHGWGEELRELGERELEEDFDSAVASYSVDGVPVRVHWGRDGQRWVVVKVDLPIPPLDPVLARFRSAWEERGAEGIAEFYSDKVRDANRAGIAKAAEKRGWELFPAISETIRDGSDDSKEVFVVFETEPGKVSTRWSLRPDGRWGLSDLKLPRVSRSRPPAPSGS